MTREHEGKEFKERADRLLGPDTHAQFRSFKKNRAKNSALKKKTHGTAMWKLGGKSTPPDGK